MGQSVGEDEVYGRGAIRMARLFGHEKLAVYQKGMSFAAIRKGLLHGLSRRVVACDHLDRGAESILVNIAHASSSWSPKERIVYLGNACGSALECAACLDIFVAKRLLTGKDTYAGKSLLAEIVSMLVRMRETTADRVCEDRTPYCMKTGSLFSHETLDVYQVELQLVSWIESVSPQFSCSSDLLSKLDKSTTSIVLNTAEGNGRFTGTDQAKFLGIAYKATVHSASLLDLVTHERGGAGTLRVEEGLNLVRRIAAMLVALSRTVANDT
jgi:four helix bundle protein